jgi:hypothetical protein
MLHEFALDPEVMTSWPTVRFLSNMFGVEHGRLISRFPKKWQKLVIEACDRRPELMPVEKKTIIEKMLQLGLKTVSTGRSYDPTKGWLENAETEHILRPFRAIISSTNPRRHRFILDVEDLDEAVGLWNVPREGKVSRNAQAMASCLTLLFQMSRSILFVDPHFTPEPRFRKPLIQFLQVASDVTQRTGRRFERIEYHLKWKYDIDIFVDECRRLLLPHLPDGCEITLFRWSRREFGEDLHARYVLTDMGGIRFDHGLDEGSEGQITDVGLLGLALHGDRLRDFPPYETTRSPSTYDLKDRIRIVGGGSVDILP